MSLGWEGGLVVYSATSRSIAVLRFFRPPALEVRRGVHIHQVAPEWHPRDHAVTIKPEIRSLACTRRSEERIAGFRHSGDELRLQLRRSWNWPRCCPATDALCQTTPAF